jgi:VWFA-related protein
MADSRRWIHLRFACVTAASLLVLLVNAAAQQTPSKPEATFKSGVDVVHVDVSVLDKDRHPVQGLSAADFVVREDGKVRPVVAFTAVELPPKPAPPPAVWMREVAPDVITNQIPREGRLVVILLDRTIRPEDMPAARRTAEAAVDQLGPVDLAAVVFTTNTPPQNFTADRRILKAVINQTFVPLQDDGVQSQRGECFRGMCSLEAIIHVAEALRDVPERRKMLLFIGQSIPAVGEDFRERREKLFRAAGVANLTIHSIDSNLLETLAPNGATRGVPSRDRTGIVGAHLQRQGDLAVYSDHSGGRAIQNTNAPQEFMPAVFAESQSYYVLGFTPASVRADGAYHDIKVELKRRGLSVHSRQGYYAPSAMIPVTAAAPGEAPASLVQALASFWPTTKLPLAVMAAAFADLDNGEASVAVVARAQHRDYAGGGQSSGLERGEPLMADILAAAYSRDGKPLSTHVQKLRVTVPADSPSEFAYEGFAKLSLKPGRYEVRVAVEEPGQVSGSVYTYVEVPDFTKTPLSLSGVVLGSAKPLDGSPLTSLLPVTPTARRQFRRTDEVSVFVRAHQGGRDPVRQIAVTARILDRADTVVVERRTTLFDGSGGTGRSSDYTFGLPLAALPPGSYLLMIEAAGGAKDRARRDVTFEVVDPVRMTTAPVPAAPLANSVLRTVASYLQQYEHDVSALVAEEDYVQRLPDNRQSRRLRSDMLIILDQVAGWVGFRDVFEVDGNPVHDRDERLAKLFLKPNANSFAQARRIVEESSRFNLNPAGGGVNRTINQPLLALKFLRAANQARSTFAIDNGFSGDGAVRLTFVESAKPRMIASPDNAAARGSFRIDPATGRVLASELMIETGRTRASIRVTFAEQPNLGLWLPVSMDERYGPSPVTAVEGRATYSNFRRFKVDTDTTIKQVPRSW